MGEMTSCLALRIVVAACFASAVLSGCSSAPPPVQKADYSATLNKYYEGRPLCVWSDTVKFPVEATSADATERGFDALEVAGLLVRKAAGKHSPKGSSTYDLSPEGRSVFDVDISDPGAGNFCYGRRKVISIDRDNHNSPSTELVDYHYNVTDPASWAKESAIQRAFPQVMSELAAPHKAEVTLLDTTDGWEVSGTPSIIPILSTRSRGATLAKAKALFGLIKQPS
ncbi:MAG: hypothetical protein M3O31_16800 [Acidobacteriota bacterium]|nr:hypothetical protein [Acidobacteriota bacterium]